MLWLIPSEKHSAMEALEKRLWQGADQLPAGSNVNTARYSSLALGLILFRFVDARFPKIRAGLEKMALSSRRESRAKETAAIFTSLPRTDHANHLW